MRSTIPAFTVTVKTVTEIPAMPTELTDLEHLLLEVLRRSTGSPGLTLDGPSSRLTGGFWAELIAFRLAEAPDGWPCDLVLRLMPDPATAAKETAIQSVVAEQCFATPPVRLAGGPHDGFGRAFMVMDRAAGGPLLGGLDGGRAILSLPTLIRRLPSALADSMAELHRLDPEAVRERLSGPGAPDLSTHLSDLERSATAYGRGDLAAAARRLAAHAPPPAPDVICHGDLHPFNLLVSDAGAVTVLDWSAARLAPPLFDVAFTNLLLTEPPIAVAPWLQPLVRRAGGFLARRFRWAYTRRSGVTIDSVALRWHEGVTCLRALVEVAGWVAGGVIEQRAGHPWLVCGDAFASRLSRLTGAVVTAR
jgi:aminoglycoside phosphotransferase (APT) family kinase protein